MDVSEALLEEEGFRYVLPYKMSQDHLELLFGRIRRMGGYNNNPNVAQLQHAMRRLMLHNFISPSATGNCTARDGSDDRLPQIRRRKPQRPALSEDDPMLAAVQHLLTTGYTGSSFVDNCVGYISGYVCRKLLETGAIGCGECIGALLCNDDDPPSHEVMGLVKVRDNDGLLIPLASTHAIVVSRAAFDGFKEVWCYESTESVAENSV